MLRTDAKRLGIHEVSPVRGKGRWWEEFAKKVGLSRE